MKMNIEQLIFFYRKNISTNFNSKEIEHLLIANEKFNNTCLN